MSAATAPQFVLLACDESGAINYADREELTAGEVGVSAGILIPGDLSEPMRAVLNGVRVYRRALHANEIASSFVTENTLKGRRLPPWKSLACPCLVTP